MPAWHAGSVSPPRYSSSVAERYKGTSPVKLRSIELFTGAGGLALALDRAGSVEHLLAVEIDRRACDTLRLNVAHDAGARRVPEKPWPLVEGDVRSVDFKDYCGQVDIVAGGVPCQPWSLGGVHGGYDDSRNLWPELFRTVRETRPRAVIAENVKGLLRPSFKRYYDYILDSLAVPFEGPRPDEEWPDHHARIKKVLAQPPKDASERYVVRYKLVNAADYGIPQQRWRVFVVAFRSDLDPGDWCFPSETHSEAALYIKQSKGDYWFERDLRIAEPQVRNLRVGQDLKPWVTLRDAISGMPQPLGHKVDHPEWNNHVGWDGARIYPGHTPNCLDRPAKTVKAGVHGVPGGESVIQLDDGSIRYMTVRETARVMTFPDAWRLAGPRGEQMRQLGNAVPVELGAVIARSVTSALLISDNDGQERRSSWRLRVPADDEWRPTKGRSLSEARLEQDQAAGGRTHRIVVCRDGGSALASIELKCRASSRRIYANLRYSIGGKTVSKYVGEVDHGSRLANLKAAWQLVHDGGLLDAAISRI